MNQISKGSKRKPRTKSPSSFQNIIEQNRVQNRALKKLLKVIEGDGPIEDKTVKRKSNNE